MLKSGGRSDFLQIFMSPLSFFFFYNMNFWRFNFPKGLCVLHWKKDPVKSCMWMQTSGAQPVTADMTGGDLMLRTNPAFWCGGFLGCKRRSRKHSVWFAVRAEQLKEEYKTRYLALGCFNQINLGMKSNRDREKNPISTKKDGDTPCFLAAFSYFSVEATES